MRYAISRGVGSAWFLMGIGLTVWTARDLVRWLRSEYRFAGSGIAVLIFLAFGVAAAVAGILGFRRARGSFPLFVVLSILVLLYAGLYVFMGGLDDTGCLYALSVALASVLALATLVMRRRLISRSTGAT